LGVCPEPKAFSSAGGGGAFIVVLGISLKNNNGSSGIWDLLAPA
jgi:hypothetical protein